MEKHGEGGAFLAETAIVVAIIGILAATLLPRGAFLWQDVVAEREAITLATDIRRLQEQSRANGYRALGLDDFYEAGEILEMRFTENGYVVRKTAYDIPYRHYLPEGFALSHEGNNPRTVRLNFGHDGGSVQNNTFKIYSVKNPSVRRFVVISSAGRIRISRVAP